MALTRIEQFLQQYETTIVVLESAGVNPDAGQLIEVLLARDAVQRALEDRYPDSPGLLLHLLDLDQRLRSLGPVIGDPAVPEAWRASFRPPAEAWWWSLDQVARKEPPGSGRRAASNVLALLLVTAALSLLVDTATRLLSGGPDTLSVVAVVSQAVLAALAAGSSLTRSGEEAYRHFLAGLRMPESRWPVARLVSAAAVAALLLAFRLSLPGMAISYNNRGLAHYAAGQLLSAQYDFTRAIQLNPDYSQAHYNLAILSEDLQNFETARLEYRLAAQGGLDAAYNNLARLYILEGAPDQAIGLLLDALEQARDNDIRYSAYKNLGWARLEQKRYAEAATFLQSAITLAPDRAPAHCLFAQVLEGLSEPGRASVEWEDCLRYASEARLDEDRWLGMARKQLQPAGEVQP